MHWKIGVGGGKDSIIYYDSKYDSDEEEHMYPYSTVIGVKNFLQGV